MPIYEYRCKSCNRVFEKLVRAGAPDGQPCPECGGAETKRLLSLFAQQAPAGMMAQAFVEAMAGRFQEAGADLNVEYDVFIRTTEERHKHAVQTFFKTLQERGDIYQGPYEGWYCVNCETFFTQDEAPEVEGER